MSPDQAAQKKQTQQRFIRSAQISGGVVAVAVVLGVGILFGDNLAMDGGMQVILILLAAIAAVVGVIGVIVGLVGAAIYSRVG